MRDIAAQPLFVLVTEIYGLANHNPAGMDPELWVHWLLYSQPALENGLR